MARWFAEQALNFSKLPAFRPEPFQPSHFHARKGDVLTWHASLLHGGSPRRNMQLSRKALVCHFFVKGAFVYHDLVSARSRQQYLGTCLLRNESGALRGLSRKKRWIRSLTQV